MLAEGLQESASLYLVGHSDGGDGLLDDMLSENSNIKGYILMGSFIKRTYYSLYTSSKKILTIQGDLDGLVRVTRIAESFYHMVKSEDDLLKFPHIIVPGLSHLSFVSSAPEAMKLKDLEAEVDEAQALEMIASIVSEFMHADVDLEAKESLF